jgi:hypothetical protein
VRLGRDDALRARLGAAARRRCEERWDAARSFARLVAILRDATA